MTSKVYSITSYIAIMPHPLGGKELSAEIEALRANGFETLVCLLTHDEIKLLGLEKEKEECSNKGIRFIHYPVNDFGVPSDMSSAIELVGSLSGEVRSGKKIIIHCRGGIGRSSLIAGALLVREGRNYTEAIKELHNSRGCKVPETPEQEAWIRLFEATERAKISS